MLEQRYELPHLNDERTSEIRYLMLDELQWSLENHQLYFSEQFDQLGHRDYPQLLLDALAAGTPNTLEQALNAPGIFRPGTARRSTQAFIWDEYNKFHMRALCRWVQSHPGHELIVVRGRTSTVHRDSSDARLGRKVNSQQFLEALREMPKVNPFGANSGLTLMIRKRRKPR